jgi:hypothetical protein
MAWKRVEKYWLRYNARAKTAQVGIKYSGATENYWVTLPGSDATFLAELLRQEEPVSFDPDTGSISTGEEVPGEQEK